ncbi:MAG TPA: hypothetical protein VNK46_16615 [Nitrospiraceae bacterium]|jgi:hypothetical protein|nr:hypothetical protein [Nitrospiraceae bacterium]
MNTRPRWIMLTFYAAAMAWAESATVFYVRTLVGRVDPYQPHPTPVRADLIGVELVREAATLVMLAAVAWLAGRTMRSRFGSFLIIFGIWDILYYGCLHLISGWPRSPLDWDILFLIPLPWWGPVLAPTTIALVMIAGGTLLCRTEQVEPAPRPRRWTWSLSLFGIVLALYVFMADALSVSAEGMGAIQSVRPVWFNWPLFLVAVVAMTAPFIDLATRLRVRATHARGP